MRPETTWKWLFFVLLAAYCGYYAPYGINETDGGFLTGLAWQVLNGKALYTEVVYVRPPLPVLLRALELRVFPTEWAILAERWVFYAKVALYSSLGAAVLTAGVRRWQLAALAFVLSVHCYPAAAWHTTDGILFGSLSIWCYTNRGGRAGAVLSGLFLVSALMCKQSFFPMAAVWLVLLWPAAGWRGRRTALLPWGLAGALLAVGLLAGYLQCLHALPAFFRLTAGSATAGQALEHGILDYFRIPPVLLGATAVLLAPAVRFGWGRGEAKPAFWGWAGWLALLAAAYAWSVLRRGEFTAPFAQTRLLFWAAAAFGAYTFGKKTWTPAQTLRFGALLALSWCASVSWGYNLPVLFALPWAFAAWEMSAQLCRAAWPAGRPPAWAPYAALFLLAGLFRLGYSFVYRDGPRAAMTEHLGAVFPALTGIYSSPEKAALYRDLRDLAARYGPAFKTLPAFPQANFLTGARPPLPLDWVVARETGAGASLVEASLRDTGIVYFIEKTYAGRLDSDPEFALTREVLRRGTRVEETPFFWVCRGAR